MLILGLSMMHFNLLLGILLLVLCSCDLMPSDIALESLQTFRTDS